MRASISRESVLCLHRLKYVERTPARYASVGVEPVGNSRFSAVRAPIQSWEFLVPKHDSISFITLCLSVGSKNGYADMQRVATFDFKPSLNPIAFRKFGVM